MNDINRRLKQLEKRRSRTSYKHLRGRHNQLEHAWNRGMGAAVAAVGAVRSRAQNLMNRIRGGAGEIASGISNRAQALIGQAQEVAKTRGYFDMTKDNRYNKMLDMNTILQMLKNIQ